MKQLLAMFLIVWATSVGADEFEIHTAGEFGQLAGTFYQASDDAPVLLIIPGSGPINRDGQKPPALGLGVYHKMANEMASRGISTLRIDKRGSYGSAGAIRNDDDLRIAGYANDVRVWIDRIARNRCVWVLGHSEGGLVASVAMRQSDANVCGVILAASAGREIDLVLHDQLTRYTRSKRILRKIEGAIDAMKRGELADQDDIPITLRDLFSPVNQAYFIDWMTYDPIAVVESLTIPILIIQGDTDVRIKPKDARNLARSLPHATLRIFDGVNHVFQETDLTFPPSSLPLSPLVMDEISHFILSGG
ncbi:alpha/beta hydrolase [Amylibacter ulvae]|uniref:Alpha/beta hydrolase n=1 Tax=Paramylibacter ulvae TaxID=1651968 RepID=A0ABQ3D654_9RHOB|nr:alpha/beta fold hydrolase [Amylibacter ulvae]GHA59841.1 alpha/beta hydrolase [Amylibacter ulvae]